MATNYLKKNLYFEIEIIVNLNFQTNNPYNIKIICLCLKTIFTYLNKYKSVLLYILLKLNSITTMITLIQLRLIIQRPLDV